MKLRDRFWLWVCRDVNARITDVEVALNERCDKHNNHLKETMAGLASLDERLSGWSRDVEKRLTWSNERLEHLKVAEELKRDVETLKNKYTACTAQVAAICDKLEASLALSAKTLSIVRDAVGFPTKRTAKTRKR